MFSRSPQWMAWSLSLLMGLTATAQDFQTPSAASVLTDEAPAGRATLEATERLIDRARQNLPGLIEAAELAAEKVIAGGRVCVGGDGALAVELCRRPGALAVMSPEPARKGDVLLWVVEPAGEEAISRPADPVQALRGSLDEARKQTDKGVTVILLASRHMLEGAGLLDQADAAATAMLDIGVGENDVALASLAQVVTGWCFEVELASALTRQGRVPMAWSAPSKALPASVEQPALIEDPKVQPVAGGQWAEQYLHGVQGVLHEVGGGSWDNIARASRRAVRALRGRRNVYAASVIPYTAASLAYPGLGRPQWLRWLDLNEPGKDQPARGDFLIALGRDERPGTEDWGTNVSLLRQATGGVAWVCIDIGSPRERPKRRDVRINPGFPADDAAIKLPTPGKGRIAPVSTPAAEIVLAVIVVQVQADLDQNPIRQPAPTTQP